MYLCKIVSKIHDEVGLLPFFVARETHHKLVVKIISSKMRTLKSLKKVDDSLGPCSCGWP